MKRGSHSLALAILGLCVLSAATASAQPTDVLKINYFANNGVAGAPDGTVRITNPGTAGEGNLCALVYVFANDQQLNECCGCLTTPDGLRTLSISKDLNSNPLTGVVQANGVIAIVSSTLNGSPCDATFPSSDASTIPALRAWATHIQNKVGTAFPITETEFSAATLSDGQFLTDLAESCRFIVRLGSGHGICTCGTGD